ncbi:MAG TPA: hypothetical protein PKD37_05875 [Oligoflexia bacterium]|nr:hypothetical protein [Oligoflexia bacterium]HMP27491.1 hypothetical protein [Oligoflexia bacterium]
MSLFPSASNSTRQQLIQKPPTIEVLLRIKEGLEPHHKVCKSNLMLFEELLSYLLKSKNNLEQKNLNLFLRSVELSKKLFELVDSNNHQDLQDAFYSCRAILKFLKLMLGVRNNSSNTLTKLKQEQTSPQTDKSKLPIANKNKIFGLIKNTSLQIQINRLILDILKSNNQNNALDNILLFFRLTLPFAPNVNEIDADLLQPIPEKTTEIIMRYSLDDPRTTIMRLQKKDQNWEVVLIEEDNPKRDQASQINQTVPLQYENKKIATLQSGSICVVGRNLKINNFLGFTFNSEMPMLTTDLTAEDNNLLYSRGGLIVVYDRKKNLWIFDKGFKNPITILQCFEKEHFQTSVYDPNWLQ